MNVLTMRWEEINFHRAIWTVPHVKAKSNEELQIVLTAPVMQILETRKAHALGPWVFPARSKSGHVADPKFAWCRILRRACIENLRLHDLRRTLGSWQAAMGSSLPVIGKSLGHESIRATEIYARLNMNPVRASVDAPGKRCSWPAE